MKTGPCCATKSWGGCGCAQKSSAKLVSWWGHCGPSCHTEIKRDL